MSDQRASNFRAQVQDRAGTTVILARGALDLVGAPRLLQAVPTNGVQRVVIDLSAVSFMDSSGLRALLEARQTSLDAGASFAIARPSEAVQRVLELVDLTAEFEIVEDAVS